MAMVRTSINNRHSHILKLPDVPPAERSVFFTEPDEETFHTHAFFWGGEDADSQFGLKLVESAGDEIAHIFNDETHESTHVRRGAVKPGGSEGDEEGDFPHDHSVLVLQ